MNLFIEVTLKATGKTMSVNTSTIFSIIKGADDSAILRRQGDYGDLVLSDTYKDVTGALFEHGTHTSVSKYIERKKHDARAKKAMDIDAYRVYLHGDELT